MFKSTFRFALLALAALLAQTSAFAQNGLLGYNGDYREIEGEQPFTYTYSVDITGLFIPALGGPTTAPLTVVSLARPEGVSEATALSFITLSQNSVTFSGNGFGQVQTVGVSINVPEGDNVGDYAYRIKTGTWPNGLLIGDSGTLINMKVTEPGVVSIPPTVSISSPADQSSYVYTPANGPLLIPFTFTGVSNDASLIETMDADLNNTAESVTTLGLGTTSASASGTLSITSGGLYTLRARASNGADTAEDTVEFTVTVSSTPPAITPTAPINNAVYTLTLGQTIQIPVGFSAASPYGPITNVTATVNGDPLDGLTSTGVGTLNVSGSGSIGVNAPGSYVFIYSATNAIGTSTATVNVTVNGVTPPPVVTIAEPAPATVVNRVTGEAPTAVPFSTQTTTPYGTIQSLTVTLNGTAVSTSVAGLSTASATGSGSFSVSGPGTYTMTATASNGGAVASASRTFTVVETAPPVDYTLAWLPPVSAGVSVEGGVTVPVKFTLADQNGATVSDEDVVIAIYEVFPDGTSSAPVFYPYGTSGPAAPDYAITNGVYQLDYPTADGAHVYKVEVYSASATSAVLLGANQFSTFAAPEPVGCCGDEIMVNHMPTVNGTVNGSIRVLLPESVTLNGGATITENLYVVGTPTVRKNGKPTFGGTVEGSGSSSPSNYQITLNGGATLGKLIRKTDALVMPVVAAPASPAGTQSITVNSSSQTITNWSAVKNVTLNGNAGNHVVPPGSYGNFISNGSNSGFTLGVAGSTAPTVYEFQNLTLNGQTKIELLGPVVITVRNGFASNGTIGKPSDPSWLTLNVYSGGFTLNSGNGFYGCVVAPNGTVIINGNTIFVGGITSDRLTVNGGANLIQVAP